MAVPEARMLMVEPRRRLQATNEKTINELTHLCLAGCCTGSASSARR